MRVRRSHGEGCACQASTFSHHLEAAVSSSYLAAFLALVFSLSAFWHSASAWQHALDAAPSRGEGGALLLGACAGCSRRGSPCSSYRAALTGGKLCLWRGGGADATSSYL